MLKDARPATIEEQRIPVHSEIKVKLLNEFGQPVYEYHKVATNKQIFKLLDQYCGNKNFRHALGYQYNPVLKERISAEEIYYFDYKRSVRLFFERIQ